MGSRPPRPRPPPQLAGDLDEVGPAGGDGEVADRVGEAADRQVGRQREPAEERQAPLGARARAGKPHATPAAAAISARPPAAGRLKVRSRNRRGGCPAPGRRRCRAPAGSRTGSSARSPRSPPRRPAGASGDSSTAGSPATRPGPTAPTTFGLFMPIAICTGTDSTSGIVADQEEPEQTGVAAASSRARPTQSIRNGRGVDPGQQRHRQDRPRRAAACRRTSAGPAPARPARRPGWRRPASPCTPASSPSGGSGGTACSPPGRPRSPSPGSVRREAQDRRVELVGQHDAELDQEHVEADVHQRRVVVAAGAAGTGGRGPSRGPSPRSPGRATGRSAATVCVTMIAKKSTPAFTPDPEHGEPQDDHRQLEPGQEVVPPGRLEHAGDDRRDPVAGGRQRLEPEQLDDQAVRSSPRNWVCGRAR